MMKMVRLIGQVAALGSGLMILVSVAIGTSYHPDLAAQYAGYAIGAGGLVAAALFLMMRRREAVLLSILALVVGVVLVAGGGYYLLQDPGDAILYAGPILLGFAVIVTEFETKGDAQ